MSNRYLKPSPLPFENNALTLFAEERPPADVVEPPFAPRTPLPPPLDVRTERPRGFVAPTLFDVTDYHAGPEFDNDAHDEGNDTSDSDREDHRDHVEYDIIRKEIFQRYLIIR